VLAGHAEVAIAVLHRGEGKAGYRWLGGTVDNVVDRYS
jgi:hypothetical protein